MQTNTFTKVVAKKISDRAMKVVRKEFAGSGYQIIAAGGTYEDGKLTLKVRFSLPSVLADQKEKDFAMFCGTYGLKPTDWHRTFTTGGRTYKVNGINTRARIRAIEAQRDDGTSFVFPKDMVVRLLGEAVQS